MVKIPSRPGRALEEAVSLWLEVGNLAPLEHAVLNGYGQLLEGRTSRIPRVNAFLKKVPRFQGRIARVHEAAKNGDLTTLALILDRPELAVSRDDTGSTPVHKAMITNHIAVVRYLLHKAPKSLTATDRMGRSPLHYAAALDGVKQGGGGTGGFSWYQFLLEEGAPEDSMDLLGRTPNFYREYCEEILMRSASSCSTESNCPTPDSSRSSTANESEREDKSNLTFQVTVRIEEVDSDKDSTGSDYS
ncbi:serine/threonine-protein phosphatase 6 regulatory ankyrin repeat subunit B-like [Neocloeon triangulifer]|uniref:serine/threonine-protein phosphatase 6 regulatory ankyrin repeat subunit B-like n=1 Tax=Neocloeon triangulifer TaxID=2078957 RepID=UPI00286F2128|nr:serine/threonine-protein phosphatase 6 regulatory ankyrin repeat subunit B-like [Neocloeon triangulifer]